MSSLRYKYYGSESIFMALNSELEQYIVEILFYFSPKTVSRRLLSDMLVRRYDFVADGREFNNAIKSLHKQGFLEKPNASRRGYLWTGQKPA